MRILRYYDRPERAAMSPIGPPARTKSSSLSPSEIKPALGLKYRAGAAATRARRCPGREPYSTRLEPRRLDDRRYDDARAGQRVRCASSVSFASRRMPLRPTAIGRAARRCRAAPAPLRRYAFCRFRRRAGSIRSSLARPAPRALDARIRRRVQRDRANRAQSRVTLRGGHRLAENLRLARAIGLPAGDDDLTYWLPHSWRAQRIPGLLGIHPGSMAYKGNEAKRWPYERFVALARLQAKRGRARPLLSGSARNE